MNIVNYPNRKSASLGSVSSHLSNQKGFTLLEVLIAFLIFSIFITVILGFLSSSTRDAAWSQRSILAQNLGRQKLYEIQFEMEEALKNGAFPEDVSEEAYFDAPFENYRWSYTVQKVKLPPIGFLAAESGDIESDQEAQSEAALATLANPKSYAATLFKKVVEESIRELRVQVFFGRAEEKKEGERPLVDLTTHLVRLR